MLLCPVGYLVISRGALPHSSGRNGNYRVVNWPTAPRTHALTCGTGFHCAPVSCAPQRLCLFLCTQAPVCCGCRSPHRGHSIGQTCHVSGGSSVVTLPEQGLPSCPTHTGPSRWLLLSWPRGGSRLRKGDAAGAVLSPMSSDRNRRDPRHDCAEKSQSWTLGSEMQKPQTKGKNKN